ncbi:MAG: hypothetical protein E4H03_06180 [Myxococcales bacterium]|nr:MAG: hypothetical protein E4H03_06180 [Myxococcales bacterium]
MLAVINVHEQISTLPYDDSFLVCPGGNFIAYVHTGVGAYCKNRQFGTIDTHHPRAQAAALEGAGARANAAQLNAWEAPPVFGLSMLIAHVAGADAAASAVASVGIVCCVRLVPTRRRGVTKVAVAPGTRGRVVGHAHTRASGRRSHSRREAGGTARGR